MGITKMRVNDISYHGEVTMHYSDIDVYRRSGYRFFPMPYSPEFGQYGIGQYDPWNKNAAIMRGDKF